MQRPNRRESMNELLRLQAELTSMRGRSRCGSSAGDGDPAGPDDVVKTLEQSRIARSSVLSPVVERTFDHGSGEPSFSTTSEHLRKYHKLFQKYKHNMTSTSSDGGSSARSESSGYLKAEARRTALPSEIKSLLTKDNGSLLPVPRATNLEEMRRRISTSQPHLPTCDKAMMPIKAQDAESPAADRRQSIQLMANGSDRRVSSLMFKEIRRFCSERNIGSNAGEAIQQQQQQTSNASSAMKQQIQMETLGLISKMSESEILECQQQLNETLKPSTLAMLKSRSPTQQQQQTCRSVRKSEAKGSNEAFLPPRAAAAAATADVTLTAVVDLPVDTSGCLNMNIVEMEKLQWIGDIGGGGGVGQPQGQQSCKAARFNLQGELMPANQVQLSTKYGLHHHGAEPDRAGYTLEELVGLSKSVVVAQRVLSISVLAKLLANAVAGKLDGLVEPAIMSSVLFDVRAVQSVRANLNEAYPSTLVASLRFFEALLCCRPAEEELLDQLLECCGGLAQPWLQPLAADHPLTHDATEDDVWKADVVEALLRSLLIERIDYIFKAGLIGATTPAGGGGGGNDAINVATVVCNIFIRLSRHSLTACQKIANSKSVLRELIALCGPSSNVKLSMANSNSGG